MVDVVTADPRVVRVVDLRTQHLGPDEILVGMELVLDRGLSGVDLTEALAEVEDALRSAVPEATQVYLEPHTDDLT